MDTSDNENVLYTTNSVCYSYHLSEEAINEMVSWGIAKPYGEKPEKWLFTHKDYERIGRAIRFKQNLGINTPGAALALKLIEEIQVLQNKEY